METGSIGAPLARRWLLVLRQSLDDLLANNVIEWAAALAFYSLLSLFPLVLALAALSAYVVEVPWIAGRLALLLSSVLPPDVVDVKRLVEGAMADRGRVGLIAIVAWLFAGRRVFGSLVTALNRFSDVKEQETSFKRRALVEVVLLAAAGALFGVALMAGPLVDLIFGAFGGLAHRPFAAEVVAMAVRLTLLVATLWAVYHFVPQGERNRRATFVGAAAAALLFVVARTLSLAILDRFWANIDTVYGPLALAAVLLVWAWYVGVIVLFGASLASHVKVMWFEGQSADQARRQHRASGEGQSPIAP